MRLAVITGASSGLGREFALQLDKLPGSEAPEGFLLIARREDRLRELAAELSHPARCLALDLLSDEALNALALELEGSQDNIQYLVNSAGFGKIGRFAELPLEEQLQSVKLNVLVLTAVTGICAPYLCEGSTCFQIASVAAFMPQPNFAVYAASKAYVLSFSEALHEEWREKGISVIAVCPNPMETEFFKVAGTKEKASRIKRIGIETPEAVAAAALKNARKGRCLSVHCAAAKAVHALSKVIPHVWVMRLERLIGVWK